MKNNRREELMIHAWHDEYLNIKLDDYILSFDDGLVSQVNGIKKIVEKFPDIEIRYYVSTGIININKDEQLFNESDIAHRNFKQNGICGDFVSIDDLIILSKIPNVVIGLHGHDHLDLQKIQQNFSLTDQFKMQESDIKKMYNMSKRLDEFGIVDFNNTIHFCMPYNQSFPLYVSKMRKVFSEKYPDAEFIIAKTDRSDINTFASAPTFLERYSNLLNTDQIKAVKLMRNIPLFLVNSSIENIRN